jgi:hypothetical protein
LLKKPGRLLASPTAGTIRVQPGAAGKPERPADFFDRVFGRTLAGVMEHKNRDLPSASQLLQLGQRGAARSARRAAFTAVRKSPKTAKSSKRRGPPRPENCEIKQASRPTATGKGTPVMLRLQPPMLAGSMRGSAKGMTAGLRS